MKCIKKNGEIRRVRDPLARIEVALEGWEYCPKSEWKETKNKDKDE